MTAGTWTRPSEMKHSAFGRYCSSRHTHAPGQARGLTAIAILRGGSSIGASAKYGSMAPPGNNYGPQSLPPQANHKHPATNAPTPSMTHTHPFRHPPPPLTPKHPCPPNTHTYATTTNKLHTPQANYNQHTHTPQQANRTHHKQTTHAPHNTQYTYLHIGGAT